MSPGDVCRTRFSLRLGSVDPGDDLLGWIDVGVLPQHSLVFVLSIVRHVKRTTCEVITPLGCGWIVSELLSVSGPTNRNLVREVAEGEGP